MHALPALLFSDEALMRLVGFNAQQVRHGVCHWGAAHRQGPRTTGPICPDALADNSVKLNVRDQEALCNSVIRPLAKTGRCRAKVTGIVDATDLETTAQYEGCGQVTRKRKVTDKRGQVHEIQVTMSGLKLIVLIGAQTKVPDQTRDKGMLWHLSSRGALSAGRRSPSKIAPWDRHTAANPGQVQAHSSGLTLYPDFSTSQLQIPEQRKMTYR